MRILLAEDEQDMSRVLAAIFKHEGYDIDVAANGQEAVNLAEANSYDCMIMDVMMPVKDGLTALAEIRASGDTTPVIMLTAKAEVEDRIQGLDTGADDYLAKPFSVKELMARVRSQTRRQGAFNPGKITLGNTTLDVEAAEVQAGNTISLSPKEARLLRYFMNNAGKSLDESAVFSHLGDEGEKEDQDAVWLYVNYLKRKLASVQSDLTVEGQRGGPYRLIQSGVNTYGSH
nr:response regulator transcription factor [uncultured Allisonella sp.]